MLLIKIYMLISEDSTDNISNNAVDKGFLDAIDKELYALISEDSTDVANNCVDKGVLNTNDKNLYALISEDSTDNIANDFVDKGVLDDIDNNLYALDISEDATDDIANDFVDKGLLDDLYTLLENKTLYTKVGQVLAEVAKSGKFSYKCISLNLYQCNIVVNWVCC